MTKEHWRQTAEGRDTSIYIPANTAEAGPKIPDVRVRTSENLLLQKSNENISKIVKINFSKTLESNKSLATMQGKEPNHGKNSQVCVILTCPILIPSSPQFHSSLENHSSAIKVKTTSLAATGGSRQAWSPQNHHSRKLLLFDLSCSSLDIVTKQVFLWLDSELTQSEQPFPLGYLSKTISNNCLILHLPEVAITVGTNNKLKRNLKSKVHQDLWKSLKHPWKSRWPHIRTGLSLYMPRAVHKARKMLRTVASPLHFLWSAIYNPRHGFPAVELCRSVKSALWGSFTLETPNIQTMARQQMKIELWPITSAATSPGSRITTSAAISPDSQDSVNDCQLPKCLLPVPTQDQPEKAHSVPQIRHIRCSTSG